jgi:hypothetical protein
MDDATARVIGGIYIALCSALSEEGVRLANDVLFGFAESPRTRPPLLAMFSFPPEWLTTLLSRPASERPSFRPAQAPAISR